MAFQRLYVDERGVEYPASYWRITYVEIDVGRRYGVAVFTGYRDREARFQDRHPIDSKIYHLSGDVFLEKYARHLEPGGPNIMELIYEYALTVKDTNDQSFFENALVV